MTRPAKLPTPRYVDVTVYVSAEVFAAAHVPSASSYRQGCHCVDCKRCAADDRQRRRLQHAAAVQLNELAGPPLGAWRSSGACNRVDAATRRKFLSTSSVDIAAAIVICQTCQVKAECLRYGLEAYAVYVWGGTSGRQRSAIRRERRGSVQEAS